MLTFSLLISYSKGTNNVIIPRRKRFYLVSETPQQKLKERGLKANLLLSNDAYAFAFVPDGTPK